MLFVSFFPQIIQGPISRFSDLHAQLFERKQFSTEQIKAGLFRILWGLFKKLVIADRLSAYVMRASAFREDYKGIYLLLCIFFYAFQIYGDFSGGIDVAIGVAQLFGIRVTDNFERPFFSKSIAEYWRRWHMTLGTWFRDYIFYPLSVNKKVLNLGKWCRTHISEGVGKRVPVYLPMIAVWILTGMWHGSESKYVVWGLLNCFFLILGTELEPVSAKIMGTLHLR
ncbi:MAG: MBOAT family protein, partial [Lachnospiraceae bacterium]|nr:MBOAT family protein [Lachnospiraceae bacterium]